MAILVRGFCRGGSAGDLPELSARNGTNDAAGARLDGRDWRGHQRRRSLLGCQFRAAIQNAETPIGGAQKGEEALSSALGRTAL